MNKYIGSRSSRTIGRKLLYNLCLWEFVK